MGLEGTDHNPGNPDDWGAWSNYVLKELEDLNERYKEISDKIERILVDIGTLKVKAGVWGLLGGLLPATVMLIVWVVKLKAP